MPEDMEKKKKTSPAGKNQDKAKPAPKKAAPAPAKAKPAPKKAAPAKPVKAKPAPKKATAAPAKAKPAPKKTTPAKPVKAKPAPKKSAPAPVKAKPAPKKTAPAPVKAKPAPKKAVPAPVKAKPAPKKTEPAPKSTPESKAPSAPEAPKAAPTPAPAPAPAPAPEPSKAEPPATPVEAKTTITVEDRISAAIFPLREPVIYPYSLTPVIVEGEAAAKALRYAMNHDRMMVIFPELPPEGEFVPLPFQLSISHFDFSGRRRSAVGILIRVVKELNFPDGSRRFVARGIRRVICETIGCLSSGEYVAGVRPLSENPAENQDKENLARQKSISLLFRELLPSLPNSEELQLAVLNAPTPGRFADLLADALHFNYAEKTLLLALNKIHDRLEVLSVLVDREVEMMRLGMKLQNEVHEAMSSGQREFFLREQLRAVKQALGEETRNPDLVELTDRVKKAELPERVKKVIEKELGRLEMIPTSAPEYHISYNYITWLLDVPWTKCTEDRLDCTVASQVLEEDHFGLEDVKARILEFLAVLQLRKDDGERRAPILCLVGPPGVGKTSLGRSIARSMNREFVRVSLGGVRDEAEIRGHRRTYVGAMPGRIIQNIKRVGSCNPVFMLDEIDKLAHDLRGDPASALLEVLDPEQNGTFNDNYLELDYDLSKVFFIATANMLDTIPDALRDRMEIIRLPGYTSYEKREIARRYLVPRQLKECGLDPEKILFQLSAIDEIIDYYTMEAGVRTLERTIGRVCRRLARRIVSGELKTDAPFKVTAAVVREVLGARQFLRDSALKPQVGCATGMAWTGAGGAILPIEVIAIPDGKGELRLTGSLGKVMQESAETAFSLVRESAQEWGIDPVFFKEHDFHIHVPDGATPKDGPSAGVTLVCALVSRLIGKPLRPDLAMTGEITLLGRVTAVGGIREKVVAALRAGERVIMMPEANRKDYLELPEAVREKLTFHFVKEYKSALRFAFDGKPEAAGK